MLEFSNRRQYFMERVQVFSRNMLSEQELRKMRINKIRSQLKSIIMGKPMSSSGGSPIMISDFVLKKWLLISAARLHRFPILC